MSIVQNPIIGRSRKSAGNMRFSTWRGLNVMATKPFEVRQNVTPAVQLNRNKMSLIGKLVSKLNPFVSSFYSLGIAKTTPFADTVKFFRTRLLDTLKLDASLLSNASFGTGNVPSASYVATGLTVDDFVIQPSDVPSIWGGIDCTNTILVVNDICTKIAVVDIVQAPDVPLGCDLAAFGFIAGDKIAFAVRPRLSQPGADLSGKVKFMSTTSFVTLTT